MIEKLISESSPDLVHLGLTQQFRPLRSKMLATVVAVAACLFAGPAAAQTCPLGEEPTSLVVTSHHSGEANRSTGAWSPDTTFPFRGFNTDGFNPQRVAVMLFYSDEINPSRVVISANLRLRTTSQASPTFTSTAGPHGGDGSWDNPEDPLQMRADLQAAHDSSWGSATLQAGSAHTIPLLTSAVDAALALNEGAVAIDVQPVALAGTGTVQIRSHAWDLENERPRLELLHCARAVSVPALSGVGAVALAALLVVMGLALRPRAPAAALVALLLAACAGTLPPDATPRQIARESCRDWLGRTGFSVGLRRGTARWDQVVELCTARHLGPAGEIDRALAEVRP